jgi:hypothetical protein
MEHKVSISFFDEFFFSLLLEMLSKFQRLAFPFSFFFPSLLLYIPPHAMSLS